MRKSAIVSIVASGAAMLAGLVGPAAASADTFSTAVSINFIDRPGPDVFRGRVTSAAPKCIENRAVRLFAVQPGPDLFVDSDRSEDNGSWSIDVEGDPAPGDYYVRVRPRTVGDDLCARAVSKTIAVSG